MRRRWTNGRTNDGGSLPSRRSANKACLMPVKVVEPNPATIRGLTLISDLTSWGQLNDSEFVFPIIKVSPCFCF